MIRQVDLMKRNWTGKLQETLLLVYISWKKVRAHTFKGTLEEVISDAFWENEGKIHENWFFKDFSSY